MAEYLIPKSAVVLKKKLRKVDLSRIIEEMLDEGQLQQTRGWLHLPSHKSKFSAEEQSLWQAVLAEFEKAHGQAIWVRDMATAWRKMKV